MFKMVYSHNLRAICLCIPLVFLMQAIYVSAWDPVGDCLLSGCVYNPDGSAADTGVVVNVKWNGENYTTITQNHSCYCGGKGNYYIISSWQMGWVCYDGLFVNVSAEHNGYYGENSSHVDMKYPTWLNIYLNETRCPQNTTFNISLIKGQNMISSPLIPENDSIEAFLNSIAGKYSYVQRVYPPGDGVQIHIAGVPQQFQPYPDFTTINRTMGYIVYAKENVTLEIRGAMSEEICSCENVSIDLTKGQNMIAWISLNNASITDALSSIAGKYSYIQRVYPPGDGVQIHIAGVPQQFQPYPDFTTFNPGMGYIIYAKENVTWKYNPCDF